MPDDRTYFFDMLNAARKIKEFTLGMTQADFENSELHQNAVVRLIQIIGEAARLVSEETKALHPDIEWRRIAGMRNSVIHRYFNIDLVIVWEVVSHDVDILITQLDALLEHNDTEDQDSA